MKAASHNDQDLIERIRKADSAAFELLYDKYAGAINGILFKILKDEETAADILQDAFVKVWTHINDYKAEKGSIFTWILNIARNKAIDKLRSKSTTSEIRNTVSNVNFKADNYEEKMQTDTIGIKDLLDKLKPEHKELMLLAYFGGFTQEEISENLNLPLGTVKTRMRTALQELKNYVN